MFFKRKPSPGAALGSAPSSIEPSVIRAANLVVLKKAGFRVAPNLPFADPRNPPVRPREEIVRRLASLEALCLYVAAPPEKYPEGPLREMIEAHNLLGIMPAEERAIMAMGRDDAFAANKEAIGWRMENLVPLAWALGNETPPGIDGEMIGGDELDQILTEFSPRTAADCAAMLAGNTMRSAAEIVAMEDLFYGAHNAVRSAQFSDPKCVPRGFDPVAGGGVIHERRHALTWMTSPGTPWGDVDLST
ncbi:MAG: DUF4272 domain-containing protein [Phycisphaerales bacterium]|nr:DUF4272 domain-containing protein [Phycisphaerales bacterium]